MNQNNRNNYLSIAKGIGIILMVIGHCGSPYLFTKFIYQFHMPLFFICSGFFMRHTGSQQNLYCVYKKKAKNIYLKFLCWSLIFLLLHNLFFRLNIYNETVLFQGQPSYPYHLSDYIHKASRMLCMNEHEQLVRSFWFLKQLFLSSITVPTLLYYTNKIVKNEHYCFLVLIGLFCLTIISKCLNITFPVIWDVSLFFMSCTFYLSGFVFRKYKILDYMSNMKVSFICIILSIIGLYILPWTNMLEYSTKTLIPFFIVAFSGTILTLNISRRIDKFSSKFFFYYIGQNTMVILALHMLCFKIGNLIKISIYEMPTWKLAEFQIIYDHNTWFWILYTIIGIGLPLLIDYLMKLSMRTKKIWNYFV